MTLAPNPVAAGQLTQIILKDFPSQSSVTLSVSDASGRLVHTEVLEYRNGMSVSLSAPTAGMYTVTARQGARSFSQKLLVVGQ